MSAHRPRTLAVLSLLLCVLLPSTMSGGPATAAPTTDPVGVWPLTPTPEVVGGFDPPDDPWGSGHRGVDLAGTPGQVVRSALPGRVSYVGRIAGRGIVSVSHGGRHAGTRTTYQPVHALVSVGRRVGAGDVIGRLERSGSHCFPAACLHWGWRRGETYLDPLSLVGGGPVRLLPLWRDAPVGSPVQHPAPAPYAARSAPWARWMPLLARWRARTSSEDALVGRPRDDVRAVRSAGQARGWAWR